MITYTLMNGKIMNDALYEYAKKQFGFMICTVDTHEKIVADKDQFEKFIDYIISEVKKQNN